MKMQILIGTIAIIAVVGGAFYQGRLCDRWTLETSEQLESFTKRLDGVPIVIGDWEATEVAVDQEEFEASHCQGVVSRAYRHSVTGQVVNVYLVSGKAYHVTIHTPDWCYVAAGFEMQDDPANYSVKCRDLPVDPDFLTTLFYKETPTETNRLRILWSYSYDGRWRAPKLAKQLLARKPALYKVYLISEIHDRTDPPDLAEDASVLFAKEFIPAINQVLFATEDAVVPNETVATSLGTPRVAVQ